MKFITRKMIRKVLISRISDSLILLSEKPTKESSSRNSSTLVSKERPQRIEKVRKMISLVVPERPWIKLFNKMEDRECLYEER